MANVENMLAGFILSILLTTTVTTGNSFSKSTAINEVSGEGGIYTKIEVEANGEKKILESKAPGTYTVTSTATVSAKNVTRRDISSDFTNNMVVNIFKSFSNFIRSIFSDAKRYFGS